MDMIEKAKSLNIQRADAAADISLINQYSIKELKPDDVYCFNVRLCDNDVDRDIERFPNETLNALQPMFLGKAGMFDHRHSAKNLTARLYRTKVVDTGEQNALGEATKALTGSAYMIRNEENQPTIDAIEGGIMKEVSVGVGIQGLRCSICKKKLSFDWRSWTYQCETGHIKGETYDEKLCVGEMVDPVEAYEFSFVAVPAQRAAGVIKSAERDDIALEKAVETIAKADMASHKDMAMALIKRLQTAMEEAEDRSKRALILAENKKFLKNL